MAKIFLYLLENYGLGVANLSVIILLAYKFASNHLKHQQERIDEVVKKVDEGNKELKISIAGVKKEVKSVHIKVGMLRERVAKIEGHIGK